LKGKKDWKKGSEKMKPVIIARNWEYIGMHKSNIEAMRALTKRKEFWKARKGLFIDKWIQTAWESNRKVNMQRREAVTVALLHEFVEELRRNPGLKELLVELEKKKYTHLTIDKNGNIVAVKRPVHPALSKQVALGVQVQKDKFDPVIPITEVLKYVKTRNTNLDHDKKEFLLRQRLGQEKEERERRAEYERRHAANIAEEHE
jgi:hypothetical protein